MKGIGDQDYYSKCILRNINIIKENEENLKNATEENYIISTRFTFFSLRLFSLIASFSKGDNSEILQKQFSETVRIMEKVWDKKLVKMHLSRKQRPISIYYLDKNIYMRWMLALSVLLDVPEEEFTILYDLVNRDRIKDALYDYLISYRVPERELSEKVHPQSPFNNIRAIIVEEDKAQCEAMIKHYLEKEWLKTYKNTGWAQAHLYAEEEYSFFGMWAFEVAAIVKIKGLDDHSFRDHVNYPDRLLHK